jgi:hypothetical protein
MPIPIGALIEARNGAPIEVFDSKRPRFGQGALLLSVVLLGALTAVPDTEASLEDDARQSADFNFVRVEYDSVGGPQEAYYFYEGRWWQRWETDFPQADNNFVFRFDELTAVHPNPRPITRRLTAPDLFEFPFLYFCDVGWMSLSELEATRLREFLLRGGFLWVDDFWGAGEWRNLERNMKRVLPDHEWQEIPADHPILSTLFPLPGLPQIPARDFAIQGMVHDPPWIHRPPAAGVETPSFRGYFDDRGRLMAVASLNTDIGDGWEREGYGQWFFERYSTVAYAAGTNIVLHALIH